MFFELLIVVYLVLFAVLVMRKLDWALYVLVFSLPSYLIRFQVFGIPMTLLEGMVLLVFAGWLVRKFKICNSRFKIQDSKFKIQNSRFAIQDSRFKIGGVDDFRFSIFSFRTLKYFKLAIMLFVVASTVSLFVAPDLRAAAGIWKAYIIEPILFLIVFVDTIRTRERVRNIIWALGLSTVIPGILAIVQKFTGIWIPNEFWAAEETRRVTSVYGYPNAIGLYFAPIITLLIGITVARLRPLFGARNIILGFIIAIGLLSVLFAQSKGAMLGIFVGTVFYAIFWKGKRMLFAGAIVLALIAGSMYSPAVDLKGNYTVSGGGSLEIRIQQWKETKELLKTRPVLGAGLAGYQTRVAPFHEKDYIEIFLYPHNIFLNFWVETGLLGLVAVVWLLALCYRLLLKPNSLQSTMFSLPVAGALTALIVHGLVDVPYFKNDLAVLFWILIGLVYIGYLQSNLKKEV